MEGRYPLRERNLARRTQPSAQLHPGGTTNLSPLPVQHKAVDHYRLYPGCIFRLTHSLSGIHRASSSMPTASKGGAFTIWLSQ
jgi:hypothetical protein